MLDALAFRQSLLVGGTISRKFIVYIEKINGYLVAILAEETGYGEGIAAIVARTRKHDDRCAVGPFLLDASREGFGGTFHQVER